MKTAWSVLLFSFLISIAFADESVDTVPDEPALRQTLEDYEEVRGELQALYSSSNELLCLAYPPAPPKLNHIPFPIQYKELGTKRDPDISFASGCEAFINKEGKLGSLGTLISKEVRKRKSTFLANSLQGMESTPRACPRWSQLHEDQKAHYWAWVFMSIAMAESDCKPGKTAKGVNGRALGLLQMEEVKHAKKAGRGEICYKNMLNATANLHCGLSVMEKQLTNGTRKAIFEPGSYWAHLRKSPTSSRIYERIALYDPCFKKPK